MNLSEFRSSFPTFLCSVVLLAWSLPSLGGVVIISGDDADEDGHCYSRSPDPDDGTLCGSLYPNALNLAISSSTSPGSGIVAIGGICGTSFFALRAWNDPFNGGPGATITVFNTFATISTVKLSDFKMLYVPSVQAQLGGGFCGLDPVQLAALNTIESEIQEFLNVGGSIIALIEADAPGRLAIVDPWGWLPFPFVTTPIMSFRNVTTTANMALVSSTTTGTNLSATGVFHMVFETPLPSGFVSLADSAPGPNIPMEHIGKPTYIMSTIIPPDSDSDGVPDGDDLCSDTVIPEGVPTVTLNPNHWALTENGNGFDFDTVTKGTGTGPNRSYTIEDTAGCSCEQIIEIQELGDGHTKHGCSISAMDDWVDVVNMP